MMTLENATFIGEDESFGFKTGERYKIRVEQYRVSIVASLYHLPDKVTIDDFLKEENVYYYITDVARNVDHTYSSRDDMLKDWKFEERTWNYY